MSALRVAAAYFVAISFIIYVVYTAASVLP